MRYSLKSQNDKLVAIIANANGSREMRQSKWNHRFMRGATLAVLGMEAACSPLSSATASFVVVTARRKNADATKPSNMSRWLQTAKGSRVSVLSTVLDRASRTIRMPSCRAAGWLPSRRNVRALSDFVTSVRNSNRTRNCNKMRLRFRGRAVCRSFAFASALSCCGDGDGVNNRETTKNHNYAVGGFWRSRAPVLAPVLPLWR